MLMMTKWHFVDEQMRFCRNTHVFHYSFLDIPNKSFSFLSLTFSHIPTTLLSLYYVVWFFIWKCMNGRVKKFSNIYSMFKTQKKKLNVTKHTAWSLFKVPFIIFHAFLHCWVGEVHHHIHTATTVNSRWICYSAGWFLCSKNKHQTKNVNG